MHEEGKSYIGVHNTRIDRVNKGTRISIGIRVLANDVWGFATTSLIDRRSLNDCLRHAFNIARASKARVNCSACFGDVHPVVDEVKTIVEKDPTNISIKEKIRRIIEYEKAGEFYTKGNLSN
jgi:predicted Zn-dependent protease